MTSSRDDKEAEEERTNRDSEGLGVKTRRHYTRFGQNKTSRSALAAAGLMGITEVDQGRRQIGAGGQPIRPVSTGLLPLRPQRLQALPGIGNLSLPAPRPHSRAQWRRQLRHRLRQKQVEESIQLGQMGGIR